MASIGYEMTLSPAEIRKSIADETDKRANVVRFADFKAE
jgi:hypothetical protein